MADAATDAMTRLGDASLDTASQLGMPDITIDPALGGGPVQEPPPPPPLPPPPPPRPEPIPPPALQPPGSSASIPGIATATPLAGGDLFSSALRDVHTAIGGLNQLMDDFTGGGGGPGPAGGGGTGLGGGTTAGPAGGPSVGPADPGQVSQPGGPSVGPTDTGQTAQPGVDTEPGTSQSAESVASPGVGVVGDIGPYQAQETAVSPTVANMGYGFGVVGTLPGYPQGLNPLPEELAAQQFAAEELANVSLPSTVSIPAAQSPYPLDPETAPLSMPAEDQGIIAESLGMDPAGNVGPGASTVGPGGANISAEDPGNAAAVAGIGNVQDPGNAAAVAGGIGAVSAADAAANAAANAAAQDPGAEPGDTGAPTEGGGNVGPGADASGAPGGTADPGDSGAGADAGGGADSGDGDGGGGGGGAMTATGGRAPPPPLVLPPVPGGPNIAQMVRLGLIPRPR